MTSEDKNLNSEDTGPQDHSRREFVALSAAAAGLAVSAGSASAAEHAAHAAHGHVVEKDVEIQTADGTCDAAFFHPATGKHPGVIVWTDIFGLRPTFRRDFGQRLAAAGYSVLVPNPFYRTQKAPVIEEADIANFNFRDPATRQKMGMWTAPINKEGAIESDAKAYVGWLDMQPEVDTDKKIGTQGYCMGGPLVFKTVASQSDRVGAGATFHGGGLVAEDKDGTVKPESPSNLIPQFKAQMYIAIAASDDKTQPDAKDKLKAAVMASQDPQVAKSTVTVYTGTFHGWTVPDMPKQADGASTYNKADAERAWTHLLALYKANLA
jgi:carboxymethylenebutenolidase